MNHDVVPAFICACASWEQSAVQIFVAQIAHTQRTGIPYSGQQFAYCPFCGAALIPNPSESTRNHNE